MADPNPRPRFSIKGGIGFVCLCVWFIFTGLIVLLNLSMSSLPTIMGLLAIVVGVLMLFGV